MCVCVHLSRYKERGDRHTNTTQKSTALKDSNAAVVTGRPGCYLLPLPVILLLYILLLLHVRMFVAPAAYLGTTSTTMYYTFMRRVSAIPLRRRSSLVLPS